jgi:DNA adenine methylase
MSSVASVERSSTSTSSKSPQVCARTLSIEAAMYGSRLYAVRTTLTIGVATAADANIGSKEADNNLVTSATPTISARPLLKWAGGKRQLLPTLRDYYPPLYNRYIEPFFGSGAVFFDLYAAGRLADRQAWLADDNADLVGCYRMLIARTDDVIAELRRLAAGHAKGGSDFYYKIRDTRFNPLRASTTSYSPEMAAMLIYLNRTGFNGLFRLNKSGAFNVPAGRYANPRILDEGHLQDVAAALRSRGVTLVHGTFDGALAQAGRGDFIYCDPPYAPLSRTASFAHYTAAGFKEHDQRRLQRALIAAAERGAHVVLSNSSASEIVRLYSTPEARRAGLRIDRVNARRAINSRADARGFVTELVITNVLRPKMLRAGYAPAIQTKARQTSE